MAWWADLLISLGTALVVFWLVLVACLSHIGRGVNGLTESLRLLPDLLRMVSRLARDPSVPRGSRIRLWLLIGYLALPFDLVPDFIPVVGYMDDAIVVAIALRSVVRAAGPDPLLRHWPGTPDGLYVVRLLAGVN